MAKRRQCREDVRIYDAKDPLTLEVIQNLYATPQKKKEIANRFNIPLEVVCKIYKVHCRGQEKFLDQYNEQKVVMQDHQKDEKESETIEYPKEPDVAFESIEKPEENKSGKDDYFSISREEFFRRQREGIEAAKAAGIHLGRPRAVLPKNFAEVYNEWKSGQITAVAAMKKLKLKRSTFYRFVKQYEDSNKTKVEESIINPLKEENYMGRKNKRKYRKHAPLTEEMVVAMLADAEAGMTATEVAKKYGISATTVSNYAKSFGITMTKGKGGIKKSTTTASQNIVDTGSTVTVVPPKKDDITPPTLAIKKIKFAKIVRVGLIDDRHNMPVDDYIFSNVPNDKMFDYKWYDQISYDWLSEHVMPGDSVIVYCTGLTAAVTSVQKQCERLNIPLTFAHFNNDTRDYCYQKITGVDVIVDKEDDTETVFKPNFARIYKDVDYINLVECTLESIEKNKKFFGIQCQEFDGRRERIGVLSTSLVDCFDMIWKVYPMYVKQAFLNTQKNIGVYVSEYNIQDDGYIECGRTISKSYNYK